MSSIPRPSDERQKQRIERFTQVFSRVNTVLTLRPLKVKTVTSLRSAPAWSTGEEITFNASLLGNLDTPREIAAIKGLDLHEVAHVLYTPRNGSELGDWIHSNPSYFLAYNALEDQRIETLLSGRYPSIKDWLTATMLIHLVETQHFDNAYPLLRGRRYLPVEVRRRALKEYKHPEKVSEVQRIVDEYRTLLFPRDTERAKVLVEEFFNLVFVSDNDEPTGGFPNPHGHGDRPHEGAPSTDSRPAPKREQERDLESAKRNEEPDEIEDEDDDETGDGSGGSGNDDSDADGDSTDGNIPNDGDTPTDGSGDGSSGSGDGGFADVLNDILEDILSDNADEIENIARQIKGLPSLTAGAAQEPVKREIQRTLPDAATVAAARSFGRELERIRTAHDPSWKRFVDAGRLVPFRAARGDDVETVYDTFTRGREDATDIECVIILDNSGSMGGPKAEAAYRAMYAIKRALDKIEASTTVLLFSDNAQTLYARDEKADMFIRDGGIGGGTIANDAVAYATKVLAETDRSVRLFIAITDGEWYECEEADEQIARMRRAGVLTALAYIPYWSSSNAEVNSHNCETAVTIRNVSDIIDIARGVVRNGIARRLLNA